MRWYLDEHVDMLFGQNARDDLYPQFLANLPNDGSYPLAQCFFQNFIAIRQSKRTPRLRIQGRGVLLASVIRPSLSKTDDFNASCAGLQSRQLLRTLATPERQKIGR
jgi:hypothetical protein